MKKLIYAVTAFILVTTACKTQYNSFGEKISPDAPVTYNALLASLQGKDSVEAKVMGEINEVCQMKGCWMNISQDGNPEESIMVKFKDYGFFVPKDASGKKVILEGIAYRTITPVEELRHYAEDAGKSKEEISKIVEPREEIQFIANGVLIKG